MQNWLLKLRRRGVSVLLVHHAGTNGRQRGTSRREDALDTVVALRRPEDYSPEQGARFEIHFEKLRNRVDGVGAIPFEARVEDVGSGISWSLSDLKPPLLLQAAELFGDGLTVREVAATLRISKSEAGRLRLRALAERLVSGDQELSQVAVQSCPPVPLSQIRDKETMGQGRYAFDRILSGHKSRIRKHHFPAVHGNAPQG